MPRLQEGAKEEKQKKEVTHMEMLSLIKGEESVLGKGDGRKFVGAKGDRGEVKFMNGFYDCDTEFWATGVSGVLYFVCGRSGGSID